MKSVIVCEDVPQHFATLVEERFGGRENREQFSITLSGGSVRECYARLATRTIDWSKVSFFWADERLVPQDNPDSNYLLAQNALFGSLKEKHRVPLAIYPMFASHGDNITSESYATIVASHTPLDIVHLGMGTDGHTASLFPNSPVLREKKLLVVDTEDQHHPHPRRTLTLPALNSARLAVFTVTGGSKADMLARAMVQYDLSRDASPHPFGDASGDVPAALVNANEVLWIVDSAAGAKLMMSQHIAVCDIHRDSCNSTRRSSARDA